MNSFNDFLLWEKTSRDTIDFKRIYIDVTGDLITGLLLSQIIYWHLPDDKGKSKLRVHRKGRYWLAKQRTDWWDEVRITPKQYDRAITRLAGLGIIEVENSMFNGKKTPCIHLYQDNLIQLLEEQLESQNTDSSTVLPKGKNRFLPKVNIGFNQKAVSLTETTTENTTETSKKNKGIFPSSQNTALSFSEFEKQYTVDEEAYGAISHYLLCYEQQFGECHPRLKAEQWQRAVDQILYCDEIGGDLEVEQIKAMIDQHFCTRYRDCDYNILHFLSDGVKKCRYYERVYNQDID